MAGICILMPSVGCGTNLEDLLYNSLAGLGRSAMDQWLTDVANNRADQDDGDDTPDDMPPDETPPDTPDGATLFADNCAGCHGADGASGFAPNIRGKTTEELLEGLALPVHSSISLTDDEVAAISEFLNE